MIEANIVKTKMLGRLIMILVDRNKNVLINIDNNTTWLTPEQLLKLTNDKKNYDELQEAIKKSKDHDELTNKIINDMKKNKAKVEVARVLLDEKTYKNYKVKE